MSREVTCKVTKEDLRYLGLICCMTDAFLSQQFPVETTLSWIDTLLPGFTCSGDGGILPLLTVFSVIQLLKPQVNKSSALLVLGCVI